MRYQITNDRGFRACLNDLFRLRRELRAAEREFESQNRAAELQDWPQGSRERRCPVRDSIRDA
jgi:hypothetical protein